MDEDGRCDDGVGVLYGGSSYSLCNYGHEPTDHWPAMQSVDHWPAMQSVDPSDDSVTMYKRRVMVVDAVTN